MSAPAAPAKPSSARRWIWALPLALFAALAGLFFIRLYAGDPARLPSALIGREAPKAELPGIPGLERDGKAVPGIDGEGFRGAVTLVNVWASWCAPCHDEAPFLMQLAERNDLRLVGINYKDTAENARRFLGRYGNPFSAVGVDSSGRASIEWGVYGVPETFVVDREGRIAFKLVGPITAGNLQRVLKPAIARAAGG